MKLQYTVHKKNKKTIVMVKIAIWIYIAIWAHTSCPAHVVHEGWWLISRDSEDGKWKSQVAIGGA